MCPFCLGHEDRTPPQTLVLPEDGEWRVRVVPNLYPALARQEVVVHSPGHARSIAQLSDDQLELVAEAWQRRRASEPDGYLQALLNEGHAAGSSLPRLSASRRLRIRSVRWLASFARTTALASPRHAAGSANARNCASRSDTFFAGAVTNAPTNRPCPVT